MRGLGSFLRDAWRLTKPYFNSEERWSARGLLVAIVALNLFMVFLTVVLNFWNGAFFNALQEKDWTAFIQLILFWHPMPKGGGFLGQMPGFSLIAPVYVIVAVYRTYLNQWLRIRWRRWLTRQFIDEWLAQRVYYRMSLKNDPGGTVTDNPDQRIAEDVRDFTTNTLLLGLDLLSNAVTLVSFLGILWSLSGPLSVFGLVIPGYMVWVALGYAIVGTWLTHLVGRPLALLNFQQQRYEADFRFSLVRFRENAEGVALYGGEAEEKARFAERFRGVIENWWAIMRRTKMLNGLIAGYNQVAIIFPFLVAAPRYFSGAIALGALMRVSDSFGQVQSALSWFVNSYASLATWRAEVERLATFHRAIVAARALDGQGAKLEPSPDGTLALDDLTLTLPGGATLLDHASLEIRPGQSTVITGRSGSGKSTLFRALAGIWPYATGTIRRPAGTYLFLPQRPYIPLGELRHAVSYPDTDTIYADAALATALEQAGLPNLTGRLGETANWSQLLSGGEQQRLAIARALLLKPDWLFLDEATANLDEEAEREVYTTLRDQLPNTTIISIAHSSNVANLHQHQLSFHRDGPTPGRLAVPEAAAE